MPAATAHEVIATGVIDRGQDLRRWGTAIGLALLGLAAGLLLQPGGPRVALAVDNLTQVIAPALAAAACVAAARRSGPRARAVWWWLGAACLSWALGQAIWSWYELVLDEAAPFPSAADVGYLGFSAGALVALWRHPTDGTVGARTRRLLDGLTITAALALLSWSTALGAVAEAGADSPLAFAIGLAYPAADAVVVSMALIVLSRVGGDRVPLALVAVGVTCIALSDSAFSYATATGSYETGGLESLGWTGGFLLLALAASAAMSTVPESVRAPAVPAGATSGLPYVPVAVAAAVVTALGVLGMGLDAAVIGLGILVCALVLVRQHLTLRDNAALVAALAEREAELRHQAFHDGLTGLANRALFDDRVDHALQLHERLRRPLAVLFCDLDDFKVVNDTLGHAAGDELLVRVAERVRGALRPGDTLARLGGDEFAVLLEDGADPAAVASRLLEALRQPFAVTDQVLHVRASIGVAAVEAECPTPTGDQLKAQADTAMYSAKRDGKGTVQRYRPGMALAEVQERGSHDALADAIAAGQVQLAYQPIVDLRTQQPLAFEALARWHDGTRQVPPSEFIPLAERTGLIGPLTAVLLGQACAQLRRWDAAGGPTDLRVGLNVSPLQIADRAFPDEVLSLLGREGVAPRRLALEITESALLADPAAAAEVTARLADAGVHLSLDDFGTGFSSLTHLSSVTLHSMKVDRSFIAALGGGARHERFVTALLRLGEDLGLEVVAEGVEDVGQLAVLGRLGCTLVQGHLFGRPSPGGDVDLRAVRAGGAAQRVGLGIGRAAGGAAC